MTKSMKKLTGFILVVCMIASLFAGATAAFAAKQFADVPEENWAKPYVDYVVDKGYFAGVSEDRFDPDGKMTRAMFVAVIAKVEGVTLDNSVNSGFNDVPAGKYYTGAVKWAADNGIVSGYSNGSFGPNDPITREQICVMMDKYIQYHDQNNEMKYLDRKASVDFKDASDIASWAKDSVDKCVSYGLVQGFPDGKFYPKKNATRAEVSVMIYRLALWKENTDAAEYGVSYKFVSGTEGVDLPAIIDVLKPTDERTFHTGDVAEAQDPLVPTFLAGGKLWKFSGYEEKTVTVEDKDVEFVGVWSVDPDPANTEYSVKYVYMNVDSGLANVPVDVPVDDNTYKAGETVTAVTPDSPVVVGKNTWTFVGWGEDLEKTASAKVEDHDIVFVGYWKSDATKYHVTYVAKQYGTGEDLPKEVAKELEGRCPVDTKEYEDGEVVWIKDPTSKSDYSDSTGRVWNYRGANYSILTTVKGSDIEVVQYWGYAGVPFLMTYANSYEDVGGAMEMDYVDQRNVNVTLPSPKTETHYSGEYVTIKYPSAMTVSKGDNSIFFIPIYDIDGEWVFQYYENEYTGDKYYPGEDEEFRMPADAVKLVAHWKYYGYADVVYNNSPAGEDKLDELLPDTSKDKVVPKDTITIKEPSKKQVKIGNNTYNYVGFRVNGGELIDDTTSYTVKETDISDGKLNITWVWETKQIKVTYKFKPSNLPSKVTDLLGQTNYPEVEEYSENYEGIIVPWELDEDDQTVTYQGETWYWGGWDKYYVYNEGKDIVFTGTWTREPTLYVSYAFVSTKKSDGIKDVLDVNSIPDTDIGLKRGEELALPTVKDVDGWKFLGWTTNPNSSKPDYVAPGEKVKVTRNIQYTGVWEKQD